MIVPFGDVIERVDRGVEVIVRLNSDLVSSSGCGTNHVSSSVLAVLPASHVSLAIVNIGMMIREAIRGGNRGELMNRDRELSSLPVTNQRKRARRSTAFIVRLSIH